MDKERKAEILFDVKWRLENIFCHFTDDRDSALDNQFKAFDDFVPMLEHYLGEFAESELDTDPVALLLMDFVYDEVDLIREGVIDEVEEDGKNVWGLYMENVENPTKAAIKTWNGDYKCESLGLVNDLIEKMGLQKEPPRWVGD